ncbi:MAG: DNA polymerase III subunit delta [Rhodospirillaceae bacterium]
MKVGTRDADRFVRNKEINVAVVLLYGPDQGLVKERSTQVTQAAGDAGDPFGKVELSEKQVVDDAGLLAAERSALVFGGGRRVIVLTGATDRSADAVEQACSAPGDGLVVVEASDLPPRSKLRKFCETSDRAAAVACYADDPGTLAEVAKTAAAYRGLHFNREALQLFTGSLGNDRMITRSEIDKLMTYIGAREDREISVDDVRASIAENEPTGISDLLAGVARGDLGAVLDGYQKCLEDGMNAVALARILQRFFQRLHAASRTVAKGTPPARAVDSMRPPIFFKEKPLYVRALSRYRPTDLGQALNVLTVAEKACKSGRGPDTDICERAVLQVARLGRAG